MDEFLTLIAKLVPVLIAVIYFIASKNREEDEEEQDPEAEERARRIQEEIRRKIIERQQGAALREEDSTIFVEESNIEWEEEVEEPAALAPQSRWESPVESAPTPQREDPSAAYERKRREIAEQLRRATELREQAFAGEGASKKQKTKVTRRYNRMGGTLRQELANTNSVRRAFVLKEILDTPVGLR